MSQIKLRWFFGLPIWQTKSITSSVEEKITQKILYQMSVDLLKLNPILEEYYEQTNRQIDSRSRS